MYKMSLLSVLTTFDSLNSNGNLRKLTLAIVGLDNAGKTVTARCLEGSKLNQAFLVYS